MTNVIKWPLMGTCHVVKGTFPLISTIGIYFVDFTTINPTICPFSFLFTTMSQHSLTLRIVCSMYNAHATTIVVVKYA